MPNADLEYYIGTSRSGKSRAIHARLGGGAFIGWDPQDEYAHLAPAAVGSATELRSLWARKPAAVERVRVVSQDDGRRLREQFVLTCMAVLAYRDALPEREPLTFVAEELADVTNPGKATAGWGMLLRTGRKRNIRTIGVAQFPAEADKTILRNANIVHVCTLQRGIDRRQIEKEFDLNRGDLDRLSFDRRGGDFVRLVQGQRPQWGRLDFKNLTETRLRP